MENYFISTGNSSDIWLILSLLLLTLLLKRWKSIQNVRCFSWNEAINALIFINISVCLWFQEMLCLYTQPVCVCVYRTQQRAASVLQIQVNTHITDRGTCAGLLKLSSYGLGYFSPMKFMFYFLFCSDSLGVNGTGVLLISSPRGPAASQNDSDVSIFNTLRNWWAESGVLISETFSEGGPEARRWETLPSIIGKTAML